MEDITDLILGRTQPSSKPAAPSAPKGDVYRFKNLQPSQVDAALKQFEEMGQDPRMLQKLLTSEAEFDAYPLDKRKRFFTLIPGASSAPQATAEAQSAPADPVVDLIMGRMPVDSSVSAPTPGVPRLDVVTEPTIEKPVDDRKVGKVKDSAPKPDVATGFGRTTASFLDTTLGGIAPGIIEPVTYAGARAFGKSPEAAKEISTSAAAPFESPFGRAFGVTETPEYKGEATRQLFDYIGENFQKGAGWIAEKTGLPVQDVENMMGTVAAGAGVKAAPAVSRATVGAAEAIEGKLGTAKPPVVQAPRIDPTMDAKPKVSYADFQAQLEATRTGQPVMPPAQSVQTPTMPAPTITQPFPEVKYAPKGKVNLPEQNARKDILSRIGLENARQSSILGDGFAAANEFQTSKVDAPVGQLYRDTLANERAALENFGQRIVERTGGTLGMDETALYNRGTAITKPFDDFKTVLQTQMKQAYDQAKQVAGGQPSVNPSNIQKFLDTDSNFTVNDNFMSLRRGIQSHLKENGLVDAEGRISPMTVEQAENLRKYVNSNWSNERSGIIGRLKDNIDNDVTLVAGKDVYKNARDIRTKIARLLDDPKGVAKIMDYDPQSPMNRAVPFEKIATTVERMDVDQQRHLIKLLKEMPPELRPQADAAIAEIRAQFANRILEEGSKNKGQWNAANITKYLNSNNRKLGVLMEDKELAQMVKDLHDAGHILKYDPAYPGAAIQAHNLIKVGAMPLLGTLGGAAGTAIGGSMFGPGGAALGGPAGAAFGAKRGQAMAEKSALKRGQKQMVPLKDVGKGK
jgi:hypothetical protein